MSPFTIAGPAPQKPALPQGDAVAAPAADLFTRLLACLPSAGAEETPAAQPGAACAPSSPDGQPSPPLPVAFASEAPAAGPAVRALASVRGKGTSPAAPLALASAPDGRSTGEDAKDAPDGQEQAAEPGVTAAALAVLALVSRSDSGAPSVADPVAKTPAAAPPLARATTAPAIAPDPAHAAADAPESAGAKNGGAAAPAASLVAPALAPTGLPARLLQRDETGASTPAAHRPADPQDRASPALPAEAPRTDFAAPASAAAPSQPMAHTPARDPTADGLASADQSAARQLDLARDSLWLDRLASDIARTAGKDGSLRFNLHPQSLGTLQVELRHSGDGVAVRLTADTDGARAILADAQPRLAAEARAQGVRIAETHVGLAGHFSDGGDRGHNRAGPEPLLRTAAAGEDPAATADEAARSASPERYA